MPLDNSRLGHRLVQIGVMVFLVAVLLGLAVPRFTVPRLALSAHLVGISQGIFLMVVGLLWPRLQLGAAPSRIAWWLLIYQGIAALLANFLAGLWGAGSSIIPMAAGGARGSAVHEMAIAVGLRSAAAALIVALLVILWGLRKLRDEL